MRGRLSYATATRLSGSPFQMGQEASFWLGGPHITEITKLTPTPTSTRLSGSPFQIGQEESFWLGGPHLVEITKLTPTPLDVSS
jgi:ribosome modulation factor